MPIYEYECTKCAARYEVKRGFHETGGDSCPECGGEGRQIFSATPSIYKCGGFYVTDSRKKADHSIDGAQPAKTESDKPAKKADTAETKAGAAADSSSPKSVSGKPPIKPGSSK